MAHSDPIRRFLDIAAARPDHPAVDWGDSIVTYGDLAVMARRFAARVAPIDPPRVMIALPQGESAYAAMIGTLLAGGTYIPVNVTAPANKLARLIELVQPNIIVADAALGRDLAKACPDAPILDPAALGDGELMQGMRHRHAIAYIILTSGSTGTPKGVAIPTGALAHYIGWLAECELFRADDRVSQFPNISFDLSVLDIYGALSAGATLVPPSGAADRLFPAEFARRSRLSVWVSVPSAMDLVITGRQATPEMLGGIRRFAFCGEALRPSHLDAIFAACPGAVVTNMYGPTEATVSMTAIDLRTETYRAACAGSVAIGEAIPGMGLHLIGGDHPDEGQLVITGPQLAAEYWHDPHRTAQAFRTVLVEGQARRGYFTGDWAERRDGHVFFSGRIDSQIKIRGFRIETGEITARLAECGWPVACVLQHRGVLTAVIETALGSRLDGTELRARLFAELEPHAVPDIIRATTEMPRNSNGKLDEAAVRAWLDEPGAGR